MERRLEIENMMNEMNEMHIMVMKSRVNQDDWSLSSHKPEKSEVFAAAWLAWEGHLTSLEYLNIRDISIKDVPRDQIEKLASIVTGRVWINNMIHTDQLGGILASINCPELWLENMNLSEAETWALVTALSDRVKSVHLQDVTLDSEQLTQYNGQGRCRELRVMGDMRTRYGEKLKRWAADKGWTVTLERGLEIVMNR